MIADDTQDRIVDELAKDGMRLAQTWEPGRYVTVYLEGLDGPPTVVWAQQYLGGLEEEDQ